MNINRAHLRIFYLGLVSFLFTLYPQISNAQTDSTGSTSSFCSRIAKTAITAVPPLHTDMNFSTLLGYVFWDSLMQITIPDSIIAKFRSIKSYDSLHPFVKFLYNMVDYDPALFAEYWERGQYLRPTYWGAPGVILANVREQICPLWGHSSPQYMLLNASYVLRIRVTSVSDDSDVTQRRWLRKATKLKCITAEILDTFKGRNILTFNCGTETLASAASSPCLKFHYAPLWSKTQFTDCTMGDLIYGKDPLGASLFQIDSEYFVFLNVNYLDFDGHSSYFNISPITNYDTQAGIYPISGGSVKDADNFFGLGASPSVDAFQAKLSTLTETLKN